jgi:hypothetical protein
MDKQTLLSSPGITVRRTASLPLAYAGRPSIPETPAITPRDRGVLDRPVKPGDDSLVVAGVLPSRSFFPGAKRRSNPALHLYRNGLLRFARNDELLP